MKIAAPYQRKKARIEIIPLIDIIFFLLATFVMVSLSMVKNQGVLVNLPVAATGEKVDRNIAKIISITKSGEILLDKEPMTLEQIGARLKMLKAENPEMKVIINGDEQSDFGVVVKVLDEIRRLGITKVAIQTKGKEAK